MTALKFVYIANIIVAGYIGISSLFFPKISAATIFQNTYPTSDLIRLVGCLWLGIAILSALGLWRPLAFSPVLLLQLIYKGKLIQSLPLPAPSIENTDGQHNKSPITIWKEHERNYLLDVLRFCNGKINGTGGAAELLDLPASTLQSKMQKLGIKRKHIVEE